MAETQRGIILILVSPVGFTSTKILLAEDLWKGWIEGVLWVRLSMHRWTLKNLFFFGSRCSKIIQNACRKWVVTLNWYEMKKMSTVIKSDLSCKCVPQFNKHRVYTYTHNVLQQHASAQRSTIHDRNYCSVLSKTIADGYISKTAFSGMICCICRAVMILKHWCCAQC